MQIFDKHAINLNLSKEVKFSCIFEKDFFLYGLDTQHEKLYIFENNRYNTVSLTEPFSKITFCQPKETFLAVLSFTEKNTNNIYILNNSFKQINCIQTYCNDLFSDVNDIWFDLTSNIIFIVFKTKIQKYNYLGDNLGSYMIAPIGVEYRAICSYKNIFFISYIKNNCSYVASYACNGAYLEHISLGMDYCVYNMQIVVTDEIPVLTLYAIKKECFPFFIKIALECEQNKNTDKQNNNHKKLTVESINNDDEEINVFSHVIQI